MFRRNWAYIKYGSWWQFFVILQVLRLASVGGRPCPGPSVQYDICNYPCDNFYWTVSAWSQCSLFEQKSSPVGKCGRGRKTRTIRLVLIHHCRNRGFFFSFTEIKIDFLLQQKVTVFENLPKILVLSLFKVVNFKSKVSNPESRVPMRLFGLISKYCEG